MNPPNQPTFHKSINNIEYSELIGLFLAPPQLASKLTSFTTLDDCLLSSDHHPIYATFSIKPNLIENYYNNSYYNFRRADWLGFQVKLNKFELNPNALLCDVNKLNEIIHNTIVKAIENNVPKVNKNSRGDCLPRNILSLIKLKRKARRNIQPILFIRNIFELI